MTFEYSPQEVRKVHRVQFSILPPDEIRAMSVCEITQTQTFDNNSMPQRHGVMDTRMGTVDRQYKCATCSGTRESCPGHFGHIELAHPLYHIGFLPITIRILKCVCYHCSRLLCADNSDTFKQILTIENAQKRLLAIWNLCQQDKYSKYCGRGDIIDTNSDESIMSGCGRRQPKFKKGNGVRIICSFKYDKESKKNEEKYMTNEDGSEYLSAQHCYEIFSRISIIDSKILGFDNKYCKPEWLLIETLPVSPPAMRPFVLIDGMRPSQDDLTHKLYDIVKVNEQLKKQQARGIPKHILNELVELLQFHVTSMIDNQVSGQPQSKHRSGKPIKGLRERISGKAGRLRSNLMGKRCDFTARTVIGGDPNLSIDEIGIPKSIALNLTYPERVTKYNINKMKQLIENGAYTYPGAKMIIRNDGKRIDLRYVNNTSDICLEYGYIIERHLQNGDIVLANRQPSLHKMSMMSMYVRILPYSTFRINLSVTIPFNADFDGDEMNIHVPQSETARAELLQLCRVPSQIITPQTNAPVMGIIQDTLLGIMKFTKRDQLFEKDEVMNLLMHIDDIWDDIIPIPCILKPKPLWSGKQILSLIIPKINMIKYSNDKPDYDGLKYMSNSDTIVRIEQGEIISGIIDSQIVGAKAQSLIHIIFNEYGAKQCKYFINGCNKLIGEFLMSYSSSIGIGDTIANKETLKAIDYEIYTAKRKVNIEINKARLGKLQRQPGLNILETFENNVNNILNEAIHKTGKQTRQSLHKLN
eukprot:424297_1